MKSFSLKDSLKNDSFRGLFGLYIGRIILSISTGLVGIFLPIFFYNIFGHNFRYLIAYYLLGYLAYGVFMPLGAKFLNKFGFKRALMLATVWGALFYSTLFFIKNGNNYLIYLIPLSLFTIVLFRLFYWLPYRVDFAKFTNKKNRGKQVSILFATFTLLNVVGPIVAGYVIQNFGFNILFFVIVVFFVLATIPFSIIPKTKEKFVWGYFETWKIIFSKKNRAMLISLMASGAENTIGMIVWPIFIFLLLNGDYLKVGAVSSFIIAGTVILQLLAGKYLDKMSEKGKMLKWGSLFYASGWIIKIFVLTSFNIFVAGLYHSLTGIFTRTSFVTIFYELAADKGHYVDEFTVFREMSIQIGRVVMLIAVIMMSFFVAIQWTFILAAIASILLNTLYIKKPK